MPIYLDSGKVSDGVMI